jgi:FixJ family two-component response regulator
MSAGQARSEKILFVDDEQNVLDAIARHLRRGYTLVTACGPEAGLAAIASQGPFAAVVSDYTMPGMNGIQFLSKVGELSPHSIRIMLTGNADVQIAIDAVNRGQIFRLLVKPCEHSILTSSLDAAIDQFRLRHAEKLLLEQTVRGSIRVMAEILSLVNPPAFGRALRLQSQVRQLAAAIDAEPAWLFETAALLSQIGLVVLPPEVLEKHLSGRTLTPDEASLLASHPTFARGLIAHVPRLETIGEIIVAATRTDRPLGTDAQPLVRIGAQLLRAALVYDDSLVRSLGKDHAVARARETPGLDPAIAAAIATIEPVSGGTAIRTLPIRNLRIGMVLDEDLLDCEAKLVIAKGHELTAGLLERLRSYAQIGRIGGTLRVQTHAEALPEPADRRLQPTTGRNQ